MFGGHWPQHHLSSILQLPFSRYLAAFYIVFEQKERHTPAKKSIQERLLSTMAIGIALIGSGIFAKEEHLPAIEAASSLVTLKALYSRSFKSAKTLSENLSDVDLYSDDSEGKTFDDLLKRDDIKGVIIA
jgi:hypothetical protein